MFCLLPNLTVQRTIAELAGARKEKPQNTKQDSSYTSNSNNNTIKNSNSR
jgi:hypothetical protein